MKPNRKEAREWLLASLKKPFYDVMSEAKLSPLQLKIAKMRFIDKLYNYQIAVELNISESKVDKEIAKAHEAVSQVIKSL